MNVNIYVNGKLFDEYTTKEQAQIRDGLTTKLIEAAGHELVEEENERKKTNTKRKTSDGEMAS